MPEAQSHIDKLLDELAAQDPTMKHMRQVLIELLEILKSRGADYNGRESNVMEQVFDLGDAEAFIHVKRAYTRMKEAIGRNFTRVPDSKIKDKIQDMVGYGLLWSCCRIARGAIKTEDGK